jgi:tol-pal system protein YbgF
MRSSWLARGILALALMGGLFGCSNVVDPATGQLHGQAAAQASRSDEAAALEAQPSGDAAATPASAAEIDRLKRENQALKVQQAENQARMDALTKQMAQEREEQRRFREMMTTNFDLLEQSVSKSLGDQMQRNQTAQAKPAQSAKTPASGPAAVPPPATDNGPARAAQPQATQGPTALEPLPYWDDKAPAAGKTAPGPAAKFDPKKPMDAKAKPAGAATGADAKSKAASAPATSPAAAPAGPNSPTAAGGGKAAGEDSRSSEAPLAAVAVMAAQDEKPAVFNDPDLQPPAHPRELKSNPEAKPLYDKGFVYMAKGDYEESIRIYKDFLARFPNDAHSDNAQFWIGEAHLQMKQTEQAEAAFRQVLRNYDHKSTIDGYKTPDAIYKLGQISLLRSDPRRAEYYLGNVAERFPESTAGQRAQRELDAIRVNTAASAKASPDT